MNTKTRDRERILSTLAKIKQIRNEKYEDKIVTLLLVKEFQKQIETNSNELNKTNLESNYLEIPKDPSELDAVRSRFWSKIHHFERKIHRVHDIQRKYGISGLEITSLELGDAIIEYPTEVGELVLIGSDLEILISWKERVYAQWADYVSHNNRSIYKHDNNNNKNWVQSSLVEVQAALSFYNWATLYKLKDDEKEKDVEIMLGNGLSLDDPTTCFCACKVKQQS